MAKLETMAKTMGLTLLNLSLEKHILQQKLNSVFVELQATQSHVADCVKMLKTIGKVVGTKS